LKQDLDEDTAARGGFLFVEMDYREHMPAKSICRQQMSEKASDVSKAIRLVAMDGVVVIGEGLLEEICPQAIKLSESFAYEAEEF
jgi:hypothetical protein